VGWSPVSQTTEAYDSVRKPRTRKAAMRLHVHVVPEWKAGPHEIPMNEELYRRKR